jgi:hypothetical protein
LLLSCLFTGMGIPLHRKRLQPKIPVKSTFTVLGNCGMCKDRIERAAYTVRGVQKCVVGPAGSRS